MSGQRSNLGYCYLLRTMAQVWRALFCLVCYAHQMTILSRARRIAVLALDSAEVRLSTPLAPEPVATEQVRSDGGGVMNEITGAGVRGIDKGASYSVDMGRVPLMDQELLQLYRHNGLVTRIVNIVPDYATRRPVTVLNEQGEKLLEQELLDLGAMAAVRQAWQMGRALGGGYILLASTDSNDLSKPLVRPAKLTALTVLDATEVTPLTYQSRVELPRFREPVTYIVSPSGPGGSGAVGETVHHTRLVYIPGVIRPPSKRYTDKTHDDSIIEKGWTAVAGKSGMDSARDSMVQESSLAVLTSPLLGGKSGGTQRGGFRKRMSLLSQGRSYLSTVLLAADETYQLLQRTWSGWKEIDESVQTQIAAIYGYPSVILWGQTPGGLTTDDQSARRQWSAIVAAESQDRMVPAMTQIAESMLPPDVRISIEVPPIDEPSRSEIAEIGLKEAQADALYYDRAILSIDQIGRSRWGDGAGIEWVHDPLDDIGEPEPENIDTLA